MGAGHYTKRTVPLIAVIKMNTHYQDILKDRNRRLNEGFPFLCRPSGAKRAVDSLRYGNSEILMKRHEPVLVGRLDK